MPPSKMAGPKDRAGLTDVPSNGTARRWQTPRVMPIARPAKPAFSVRAVTISTTSTSTKVIRISIVMVPPRLMFRP